MELAKETFKQFLERKFLKKSLTENERKKEAFTRKITTKWTMERDRWPHNNHASKSLPQFSALSLLWKRFECVTFVKKISQIPHHCGKSFPRDNDGIFSIAIWGQTIYVQSVTFVENWIGRTDMATPRQLLAAQRNKKKLNRLLKTSDRNYFLIR